jgi:hypothetical protein
MIIQILLFGITTWYLLKDYTNLNSIKKNVIIVIGYSLSLPAVVHALGGLL